MTFHHVWFQNIVCGMCNPPIALGNVRKAALVSPSREVQLGQSVLDLLKAGTKAGKSPLDPQPLILVFK